MPAVKCRCGAKVNIPNYKIYSAVACPVCRQPLPAPGQIQMPPVEPQLILPEPPAPWQVIANLRRSAFRQKMIGVLLGLAALFGLAMTIAGWSTPTRRSYLSTAEGAAVDRFLRQTLPEGKYEFDLWIGPRRVEALEDAMIQEETAEIAKAKEAFAELEKRVAIIGRDLTAEEREHSRDSEPAQKRLADLKRMRPMLFYRMKYRCRDEQGIEEPQDQIFLLDGGQVFQVPAPIADRFLNRFEE